MTDEEISEYINSLRSYTCLRKKVFMEKFPTFHWVCAKCVWSKYRKQKRGQWSEDIVKYINSIPTFEEFTKESLYDLFPTWAGYFSHHTKVDIWDKYRGVGKDEEFMLKEYINLLSNYSQFVDSLPHLKNQLPNTLMQTPPEILWQKYRVLPNEGLHGSVQTHVF